MPTYKPDADVLEREPTHTDSEAGTTMLSARARADMHRSVARLKRVLREVREDEQDRDRRGPRERG
jgi:hypothetical protein